eukprot:CAMPEP_0204914492 /NCGR_PEP_ID=MMETSP1397-20131031/12365_1 /ASSEMBLY_ACC=CAM_ASM_000891 /TAXON_ID=49980 /ORGANISM="Climacostomum Climacostomum virens, Strain Stock W-24" /LENGTH=420 /DNA_ID=CAMNT_0052086091 /DNA_START=72 /DNA_END=1334 /DNA_ORIENTATION=-
MPNSFYFNIDSELVYEPFCSDFGPLNIAMTYKFCIELEKLLRAEEYSACKIYHFASLAPNKRANAAYLMGAFQILVLRRSAEDSWRPFTVLPPFTPFRDASFGGCTYQCTILHCLKGLQFAVRLGWFSLSTFNLQEYEHNERVENGDFNWIIPNKLLAFSSPAPNSQDGEGWRTWTPEDYAPVFRKLGVTAVVRLNKKTYDADRFTRLGMRHYDLYFLDGSVPSDAIVKRFLHIAETEPGAIAIHCKAGLGRTGTLIGCYAMKHFRFPAPDFIGYIRVCRPGSVLGPQQQFLCEVEQTMHRLGEEAKSMDTLADRFAELEVSEEPKFESPHMSPLEEFRAVYGDRGQAERLLSAKRSHHNSPTVNKTPEPAQRSPMPSPQRTGSTGPASSKRLATKSAVYSPPKVVKSPPRLSASRLGRP